MLENFEEQNLTLKLSKESLSYLKETAKWGKFLAIVGFVMSGLLIVFGFFAGSIFAKLGEIPGATPSPINPVFFSVFYMLFAAIYVLPCYFLYKYSTDLKSALNNTNSDKFIGILTAVILGLYLLIFVVAAIGGAAYFMSMSK
jgi:uncharacterized integral membrane protein